MASVVVYDKTKVDAVEAASVVGGAIVAGRLELQKGDGTTLDAGAIAATVAAASATTAGIVELATTAEVTTGTDATRAVTPAGVKAVADTKQPLDPDLTTIAGLSATTDNVIQSKAGAWASRTMAQLGADLKATGLFPDAAPGSTTYIPFRTVGPTGSGANHIATGTNDHTVIQAARTALPNGGVILLAPGTYNCAAAITDTGNDTYDGKTWALVGSGAHSSTLVFPANVNGISLTGASSFVCKDLGLRVTGTGSAVVSTMGAGTPLLYQAFRDSLFENIYISKNGTGAHTGWAMNLGSAFRSRFSNIEVYNLHNGIRMYSQHANFNPGDLTFDRMFVELDNVAGSIGLHLDSPTGMGSMNQMTFNMVEFIDNSTGGTAIKLSGSGGGGPNHNIFTGINIEQFATLIDVDSGTGNRFDLNYVETLAAGTAFKFGSASSGNKIRSVGMLMVGTKTVSVINDANTWTDNPNSLEDCYIGVDTGGVANATTTAATRILGTRGYNTGTLASALAFGQYPWTSKRGDTVSIAAANTTSAGFVQEVTVVDDGSATTGWIERLMYKFKDFASGLTRNVFYLNEYGEIRISPARHNTVGFRAFVKEFPNNPTDARSATVPVMELMDNRTDRNSLWGLVGDGTTVVKGNRMAYVIVLSAAAAVPAGLPAGTVIVRTAT